MMQLIETKYAFLLVFHNNYVRNLKLLLMITIIKLNTKAK